MCESDELFHKSIERNQVIMSLNEVPKILQSLPAHASDVTCCDFAPNFTLITSSGDKTVKLWEWKQGEGYVEKEISPLRGHKYGVTYVKVSPQGSMLASASIDGTAVLWNLHSGTKIHTMVQINGDAIRVCRFAPDSSVLATGGDNGAICFWDLIHRSLIRTIYLHEGATQGLAFTPDSQFVISGCSMEILNVWLMQDIEDTTKERACTPAATADNAHDMGILCVDVSPLVNIEEASPLMKQYTVATGGNCDKINIWTLASKASAKHKGTKTTVRLEKTATLRGHSSAVTCVRYNSSGTYLASSSIDKLVKIWNGSGACIATLQGHTRYVTFVSFSRDSALLASGSNDKSVIIWDLTAKLTRDTELVKTHVQLGALLQGVGVQEMQVVREAESDNNNVSLLEKIDDISESSINSCAFYGDDLLATGSSDKMVRLFKVTRDSEEILEEVLGSPLEGHSYAVNHVEFSKDGSLIASCSLDGWATIWNAETCDKIISVPENNLGIRVCRFSPDSVYLLTAGDDERAFVWNCRTMEKVGVLEGHTDAVTSACFTPDGKIIATTSNNGDVRLWRISCNIYIQADGHDLGVQSCDFSQNFEPIPTCSSSDVQNYLLATCGNDSAVKLWTITLPVQKEDLDYGNVKVNLWRSMLGHGGSVTCVRFSQNASEFVCSTATDRQARIWSVYSADCLHVLDHDSIVTTCSFSFSCSTLAVGCLDKTLWLWKMPQQLVFQTAVANKIKCRSKAVVDWKTSDVIRWLKEIGLDELANYVVNTSLDGQKLLTLSEERVCSGLSLDDDQSKKLTRELKWLKQSELQQPNIWDKDDTPLEFLCPITHEIMREPVTISDGFTYEKRAITEWFMSGKFTSPMTNVILTNTDYTPNQELRNAIYTYLYSDD